MARQLLQLFSAEKDNAAAATMRESILRVVELQGSDETFPQAAIIIDFGGQRALELMRDCSRRSLTGPKSENFRALLHHLAERQFGMIDSVPQKMQLIELHAAMGGEPFSDDDFRGLLYQVRNFRRTT